MLYQSMWIRIFDHIHLLISFLWKGPESIQCSLQRCAPSPEALTALRLHVTFDVLGLFMCSGAMGGDAKIANGLRSGWSLDVFRIATWTSCRNEFMLTTLQVELAAISSSKGKSLDLVAFGWALSTTCNGISEPRCCFTACACRHDARCHSLPAEWYRFAWCMSLSFASASAVFNCHMNKLQKVPEQFCNACSQPYGHDPADCKNKDGRWCTILSVRSTIPHHTRFSVNCHKMLCFVAPTTPYVYWSSLGLVAKSLEFWISFDLQHFKMHHPLWPDHHGKRVWGGSIPSTDSEYVKLFNQAAGAPSQKEALEARRRF